jgi:serine/threonine protein kinase
MRLGPYEIVARAGAGGMGEVYRAHDSRLDRDVAIKVLPDHLSASPELRERFEREARAISQLSHPHICVLYDIGKEKESSHGRSGERQVNERLRVGCIPKELLAKHVWSAAELQEELGLDEKQSAKMYPASSGEWFPGA